MKFYLTREQPGQTDHELLWSLVGLLVFCAMILGQHLLGLHRFPKCTFHSLTGLPCLTCGSTRALFSLLSLNFTQAFYYNPLCTLFWLLWLIFVPYGLAAHFRLLPKVRAKLSASDWMMLRFAIPAVAVMNWVWLIADGR